jgi:tetratricopeptide (TPR) repeat protein
VTWRVTASFLLLATNLTAQQRDSAVDLLRRAAVQARDGRAESQRTTLGLLLAAADVARTSRDRTLEGYALLNAAQVYNNLGRPDSARMFARRGLDRMPRRAALKSAPLLLVLGETMQYLGRPDSALVAYRLALPNPALAGSRADARALSDIGSAFHQLGVLDSADWYLGRARELRERLADTLGLAATLNNLGRVQQTIGRPDSAAALFAAAIPLRRAAGDLAGLGATLNNLGYALDLQHRPAAALEQYWAALQALESAGNVSTVGLVRINMGRAELALGRTDSARAAVLEGLRVKRRVGDSTGVTWGLVDLGRVERARKDRPAARQALEEARRLLRLTGDRGREGEVLYQLGSLARDAGPEQDLPEALARFDSAAAIRSSVGSGTTTDQDRLSFAEQDIGLFEEWVLTWLDRTDLPPEESAVAALAAAERGRSRALLDLMRERRILVASGADLVGEGRRIVEMLRREGGTTLVYLAGRDTLVVWVVPDSGAVTAHRVPAGRAAVAQAVEEFRRSLEVESGCEPPRGSTVNLSEAGARLAALLVSDPVRRRLPPSGELLLVPYGPINLVPFAGIPLGSDGEMFGARFALRYAPSLASAIEASSRRPLVTGAAQDRWRSLRPALVLGNPRVPLLQLCGVRLRPRPLPAADTSSRWVASRLGTDALVDDRATERALRSAIGAAGLIHLETHGFAFENEARARESFVALAADPVAQPLPDGDGRLTVGEILDQLPRLRAELVVLGACQTGLGDLKDAEGTVGLQRAFLARGVRSTLVSLWDIDDRASSALIKQFYVHWLGDGVGKAEALRRAQDAVRRMPGYDHPKFWAGFVLAGSD